MSGFRFISDLVCGPNADGTAIEIRFGYANGESTEIQIHVMDLADVLLRMREASTRALEIAGYLDAVQDN